MAKNEATLIREIQIAVSATGCRVFRNNVGLFESTMGNKVRTGLCKGSSDLIGWTKFGRFLSIEVKTPGSKPTREQAAWIAAVKSAGGVGFVAVSAEDAIEQLRKAYVCG